MGTLLIFVKNPEKGKVKTRLAKDVGDDRALAIYCALMEHTRKVAQSVEANRLLFYSQQISNNDDWPASHFNKFLQYEGNLGERMQHAFAEGFRKEGPVLIVGSDCAQLTPQIIEDAFEALKSNDFVVGPAEDGGYYLIGMRTFSPAIFDNVEWSTAAVFPQTMLTLQNNNWSVHLLPILSDIDYKEDWEKHGWKI